MKWNDKMTITNDIIKALKPCADGYENFTNNYPNYSGDAANFLSLENIDYEDKVWVMTRLLTKNQNAKWAIACANSVLPIFERAHPKDMKPRELLEFISSFTDLNNISNEDLTKLNKLRNATTAAANSTSGAAAYGAAYAAASAANYTAYSAAATTTVSAYTTAAYANAACVIDTYAVGYAHAFNSAKKVQQDLNLRLLLEVLCE